MISKSNIKYFVIEDHWAIPAGQYNNKVQCDLKKKTIPVFFLVPVVLRWDWGSLDRDRCIFQNYFFTVSPHFRCQPQTALTLHSQKRKQQWQKTSIVSQSTDECLQSGIPAIGTQGIYQPLSLPAHGEIPGRRTTCKSVNCWQMNHRLSSFPAGAKKKREKKGCRKNKVQARTLWTGQVFQRKKKKTCDFFRAVTAGVSSH